MREISHSLSKYFSTGLRKEPYNKREVPGLVTSYNAVPSDIGLKRYKPFTSYFPQIQATWPFPQLFIFKERTFVGMPGKLYEYVDATDTFEVRISLAVTDPWTILDFSPFFICNNEFRTWTYDLDTSAFVEVDYAQFPRCSTIANYKGQLIAGGEIVGIEGTSLTEYRTRVLWSRIGTMNFEVGRANIAGYMELEAGGAVKNILPLDKGFVAYSSRQIVYFPVVSSPTPTFGKRVILESGIAYSGSVCKGTDEHLALTVDGTLYRVSDKGLEKLGYKEFFADFKNYRTVITYNSYDDEYYISNGLKTFVYRKEGLGELGQPITSGGLTYEGEYVVQAHATLSSDFMVVTDTFDMNIRAQKTLYAVEVTGNASAEMEMSIFWRPSFTQGFRQSKWIRLGPTGVGTLPLAGVEFRLAFRALGTADVYFDAASVRWKLTDKRHIRGMYAHQAPTPQYNE